MRHAVTALLAIHGLIHLLGFLKWSGLAAVPQLSGRTLVRLGDFDSWLFALLWLVALLILLGAAGLRLGRAEGWWMVASVGIFLSQALITFAWADARAGTALNLLLLVPVVLAVAKVRFERAVDAEMYALLAAARPPAAAIVTADDVRVLPEPVGRWLERSGVVGKYRLRAVRLTQRGALRTSPEGSWMPAEAEQTFQVEDPAFVWRVETRMFGFLPVAGRDRYAAGRGHMLIKAASLLPVVDVQDDKIAHGALLRFLGEIVWFPAAASSPYLSWERIDDRSARATIVHAGLTASATFHFDDEGRVHGLSAERYLGGGTAAQLTAWNVSCSAWERRHGVEVPVQGDVSWDLPGGRFSYYRWQIVDIDFDAQLCSSRRAPGGGCTWQPTSEGHSAALWGLP